MDSIGKSSKSKSKSSKSIGKSRSKSKSKSPKEYPITESRKFPKFPKNAVFPDSEYAKSEKKRNSHHALNPIVNWPPSRIDQTRPDLNIACNDNQLPQKVIKRMLELRKRDITCRKISLKTNGTYDIEGSNGVHYIIFSTTGLGKNKYSKKNKSKRTKTKSRKNR